MQLTHKKAIISMIDTNTKCSGIPCCLWYKLCLPFANKSKNNAIVIVKTTEYTNYTRTISNARAFGNQINVLHSYMYVTHAVLYGPWIDVHTYDKHKNTIV